MADNGNCKLKRIHNHSLRCTPASPCSSDSSPQALTGTHSGVFSSLDRPGLLSTPYMCPVPCFFRALALTLHLLRTDLCSLPGFAESEACDSEQMIDTFFSITVVCFNWIGCLETGRERFWKWSRWPDSLQGGSYISLASLGWIYRPGTSGTYLVIRVPEAEEKYIF